MYMSLLAHVDPRIAALGCADPQCRPNGVCTSGTCKVRLLGWVGACVLVCVIV